MRSFFKSSIIVLMLLPIISGISMRASTLSEILAKFDARTSELDTAEAFYSQDMAIKWFNMAQHKIQSVGNYVERQADYLFDDSSFVYTLPSDFARAKNVLLKANKRWYPATTAPAPEGAANSTQFTISWQAKDTAHLNLILGDLLQVSTDIVYDGDSALYHLPQSTRRVLGVMVWADDEWHTAVPMYPFRPDTMVYQFFVAFENTDTAALFMHDILGENQTDVLFDVDSVSYDLPTNFRRLSAVMVRAFGTWYNAFPNPYFTVDTNIFQYFVAMHDPASAVLYAKNPEGGQLVSDGDTVRIFYEGLSLADGDTLRVVYLRRLQDGDSLRVTYWPKLIEVDSLDSLCRISDAYEVYIIEEMLSYYEQAKRNYQAQQLIWQESRTDMGILKTGGKDE